MLRKIFLRYNKERARIGNIEEQSQYSRNAFF